MSVAMRVGELSQAASDRSALAEGHATPEPSECRALVKLSSAEEPLRLATHHQQAPFLAQLLAAKHHHPQARARRRAEPGEAVAAYRAAAALARR
jgi:hypothetical protein